MRPQGTAGAPAEAASLPVDGWMAAPSACFSALLHSQAAHVGISSPPGSHSTTVTLIGAQANSEGALGARCFSSPMGQSCHFLTQ